MSVYTLCQGVTANQTITNVPSIDGSNSSASASTNQVAQPTTTAENTPPQSQGFQLTVKGSAGNVSATAHIVGSNDGITWAETGTTVAATSASLVSSALAASANAPYLWFGAYISAISGTNAKASVTMCA
jgi:hypothetical protein